MAIISGGILECGTGINSLCDKRTFSLHRASGHRSGKGSVSVYSSKYSENEKGNKKAPRKISSKKGSSSWWLPLFGWSPDQKWAEEKEEQKDGSSVESVQNLRHSEDKKSEEDDKVGMKRRSKPAFTAEKAKILRKNLRTTSNFHDVMYHSAIASRLASADISEEEEEEEENE